jgi:hypothetical protein
MINKGWRCVSNDKRTQGECGKGLVRRAEAHIEINTLFGLKKKRSKRGTRREHNTDTDPVQMV